MTDKDNSIKEKHFFRHEIIAGFTTFFTMAYIIVVNPMMLNNAGMDYGAVFVATCLSAAFGSFIMGILANYPIALAPSLSLNAYFSFYVIQQLHFSWQSALGVVFCSGVLFALLSFTQMRQWLIYSMPHSLKMALSAGIGLFLIMIALKSLHNPSEFFSYKKIGLCALGLSLVVILDRLRVIGAILLSMIIITLLGIKMDLVHVTNIVAMPPSIFPTFFKLTFPSLTQWQSYIVILIFLYIAVFDNTGTLIAILHQAKLLPSHREDVRAIRLGRALFADSLASIIAALLGTSNTGSYIESAAGVRAGGRTGLTAIVVGILFLFALFFAPLVKVIPDYAAATALIYVGGLMFRNVKGIHWKDLTESISALLCLVIIPITFSIADGVAAGFLAYVMIKSAVGKRKELDFGFWLIAALCLVYLIIRI